MTTPGRCPKCGAPLAPGAGQESCPRCLLALGLVAPPPARAEPEASETLPRIGSYRLLSILGEGGMGTVYLAEQEEPIHRRVALKVIKRGMDSREVIARFETERQALALMSHPGIARVFEAGTTGEGLPYFVMEHVAGIPVTDYCDENRLTAEERLRLFVEICEAVQHAHQKGVIHRDLKPSNVLVTVEDGRARVKVIDFGVAKATGQRLTEHAFSTGLGLLIGTPGYMSPEQAEMTELDIDTRTDVYSLGVLLYELLAGGPPFDPRRLREAGWVEMARIIREEEPVRPSTRVSTLGEGATAVADQRRTDPGTLRRDLKGDLDWITLKALEKDRTRRYGAASELAADVERHLRHEPVNASPPDPIYRFRKLVRRHRAAFAAAAAVFLALTAGLVGTMTQARRAARQAAIAGEQRDFALRQLSRAEAINDLNAYVLSDAAPLGKPFTAGELLARAESIVGKQHAGDDENRIEMLVSIGRQYQMLDEDDKAGRLLETAYAASRRVSDPSARAKAACALASVRALTGDHPGAEALLREAEIELPPHDLRFALDRIFCSLRGSEVAREGGDASAGISRALAARRVFRESRLESPSLDLRLSMAVAESYRMAGRNREAGAAFEEASVRLTSLGRDETETAGTLFNNWGVALNTLGRPLEAERLFRRAIAISSADGTERNVSPILLNNLARTLRDLDRLPDAAGFAERAYAAARRAGNEVATNQSLSMRNTIYRQMGDFDRAAAMLDELEPRIARMLPPDHIFFSTLVSQRSLIDQARGNLQKALAGADRAIEMCEQNSQRLDYMPGLLLRRSGIALQMGRFDEARSDAAKALEMEQKASEPGTESAAIGRASLALGRALLGLGDAEGARAAFTAALAQLEPTLGTEHPDTREARRGAASSD